MYGCILSAAVGIQAQTCCSEYPLGPTPYLYMTMRHIWRLRCTVDDGWGRTSAIPWSVESPPLEFFWHPRWSQCPLVQCLRREEFHADAYREDTKNGWFPLQSPRYHSAKERSRRARSGVLLEDDTHWSAARPCPSAMKTSRYLFFAVPSSILVVVHKTFVFSVWFVPFGGPWLAVEQGFAVGKEQTTSYDAHRHAPVNVHVLVHDKVRMVVHLLQLICTDQFDGATVHFFIKLFIQTIAHDIACSHGMLQHGVDCCIGASNCRNALIPSSDPVHRIQSETTLRAAKRFSSWFRQNDFASGETFFWWNVLRSPERNDLSDETFFYEWAKRLYRPSVFCQKNYSCFMQMYVIVINFWGVFPDALLNAHSLHSTIWKWSRLTVAWRLGHMITPIVSTRLQTSSTPPSRPMEEHVSTTEACGYRVKMFGAFGLNTRLDPQSDRNHIFDAQNELRVHGIDTFSHIDGAYYAGCSLAHDKAVLHDAIDLVLKDESDQPTVLWFNLLECADTLKRRVETKVKDAVKNGLDIKYWSERYDDTAIDGRKVPPNVYDSLHGHQWSALIDEVCDHELSQYGEKSGRTSRRPRTVHDAHEPAWDDLCSLDEYAAAFLKVLMEQKHVSTVCSLATHVFSLQEFGGRTCLPVEACCRSFWCRTTCAPPSTSSRPVGMKCGVTHLTFVHRRQGERSRTLWNLEIGTANSNVAPQPPHKSPMSAAPLVLPDKGRIYSMVYAWTLRDLTRFVQSKNWRSAPFLQDAWRLSVPDTLRPIR